MAEHRTSDEVERQYVEAMGSDLGRMHHKFWNECAWLHWKWDQFVILFGTSAGRVDLLNAAAGGFFRTVQDSLWEDVLLHICRLTDPPQSHRKDNLTLKRLPPMVAASIRPEIKRLLGVVLKRCDFARNWRNRHMGHRDLRLALQANAKPLASASRRSIKDAIAAIATLLNAIEAHYCGATVAYDIVPPDGNAEALLYVLRDGIEAKAEQRKRFEFGQILPEDLKRKPAV